MARTTNRMLSIVSTIEESLEEKPYPIERFEFILDDGSLDLDVLDALPGMPVSNEFYYEYQGVLYGKR